jgi:hypothetical protein
MTKDVSGGITYIRTGVLGRPLVYHHSSVNELGAILVLDLHGERRAAPLRDRLLDAIPLSTPRLVICRGASQVLSTLMRSEEGQADLREAFPSASVWELIFDPSPRLEYLCGSKFDFDDASLLRQVREVETLAFLIWADGIWGDLGYHFIVPSGQHADKFVRMGDVFSDPIAISRSADWIASTIPESACLICDTVLLLPLLQELRVRHVHRFQRDLPVHVLPLYAGTTVEFRASVTELVPLLRETRAEIHVVVSVSATGGYVLAIRHEFESYPGLTAPIIHTLCHTGVDDEDAWCHVKTQQFPDEERCEMCQIRSPVIEIDQRRFTTRFGTKILPPPTAPEMQVHAPIIVDAVEQNAFSLHVDRLDRHGHLSVFIHTPQLLKSKIFCAAARVELARCLLGFTPDLVLIPQHDNSEIVAEWVRGEGLHEIAVFPLTDDLPQDIKDRIAKAKRILLCDDCVISSRTMRAAVEVLQRTKEQVRDDDYQFRGFVLVGRPALPETWQGLRARFYVNKTYHLYSGWLIHLPDRGYGGRHHCPWCAERETLGEVLLRAKGPARAYLEERCARLSDPNGLQSRIYLLSELADTLPGWEAAIHTTPTSYLGSTTDVGAFVSCAGLIQSIRNKWNTNIERLSSGYALSLDEMLQRFTDPVIASAILRSIAPQEVRHAEVARKVRESLREIDHALQHPVFVSELLLAALQEKLTAHAEFEELLRLVEAVPDQHRTAVVAMYESLRKPLG